MGRMAGEGDGQDSRSIVKPVPFEQARAKLAGAEQHIQRRCHTLDRSLP
jgi:hypothetical protein